jgi:hypothetical protein
VRTKRSDDKDHVPVFEVRSLKFEVRQTTEVY